MVSGRGGMGSHKHGVSGHAAKNARYKAMTLREDHAERAAKDKRKKLKPALLNVRVRDLVK